MTVACIWSILIIFQMKLISPTISLPTLDDEFLSCKNNGCRNNGTCSGDRCTCFHGFTGILCQSEILECLSQPCKNNGICNDRIGFFKCTCQNGYTGSFCEKELPHSTTQKPDDCPPCQNGTCLHDVVGAVCVCNAGFTGKFCTIPLIDSKIVNSCEKNFYGPNCRKFCKEFDDCVNGHYYCDPKTGHKICRSGWSGNNCTTRDIPNYIDKECPPNLSCKNDGNCFNQSCCCRAGFTGKYCETHQLTCSDRPCPSSCTCRQLPTGYLCHCPTTTPAVLKTSISSKTKTTKETTAPASNNPSTHSTLSPTVSEARTTIITTKKTPSPPAHTISMTTVSTASIHLSTAINFSTVFKISSTATQISPITSNNILKQSSPLVKSTTPLPITSASTKSPTTTFSPTSQSITPPVLPSTVTPGPIIPLKTTIGSTLPSSTTNGLTLQPTSTPGLKLPLTTTPGTLSSTKALTVQMTSNKSMQNARTSSSTSQSTPLTTSRLTTETSTQSPIFTSQHAILFNGTLKQEEIPIIQQLLKKAGNKTGDANCNPNITVTGVEEMLTRDLQTVTKILYRANECFNDTGSNFLKHLQKELNTKKPFSSGTGSLILSYSSGSLVSLREAMYDISINGYLYRNNLQKIKRNLKESWKIGRPEANDVDILIVGTSQMIGSYGTRLTKIQYLSSSRGSLVTPKMYKPPPSSIIEGILKNNEHDIATVYHGVQMFDYTNGIRLTLRTIQGGIRLANVTKDLVSNFLSSLKGTDQCRNVCNLKIVTSSLEETFNPGTTDLVYFPVLNNNFINYKALSNVHHNIGCSPPCPSSPRRQYVDINGHVKLKDMKFVRRSLIFNNGAARGTRTVSDLQLVKQNFLALNEQPVTRVWFSEHFNDSKTQWPNPNLSGRLDNIERELSTNNMNIYTDRVNKIYEINLEGTVHTKLQDDVTGAIRRSWESYNVGVQNDTLTVKIHNWDINYFSESRSKATKLKYSVSVFNTDSSNTALQEPSRDILNRLLPSGILLCNCVARKIREIRVSGQISLADKIRVQIILTQLWMSENNGLGVNFSSKVRNTLHGFQTERMKPAVKIQYFISPTLNDKYVDENDLDEPSYGTLQITLQNKIPGLVIENKPLVPTASVDKDKGTVEPWIIIVAVAAGVLVFILLVTITLLYRSWRHQESRTLKQSMDETDDFDKEHFSEQPDFDSPRYSFSENSYGEESERKNSYDVNS